MSDQITRENATKVRTEMYTMYSENTAWTMRAGTSTNQNRTSKA
jgi:hypothetical protein